MFGSRLTYYIFIMLSNEHNKKINHFEEKNWGGKGGQENFFLDNPNVTSCISCSLLTSINQSTNSLYQPLIPYTTSSTNQPIVYTNLSSLTQHHQPINHQPTATPPPLHNIINQSTTSLQQPLLPYTTSSTIQPTVYINL